MKILQINTVYKFGSTGKIVYEIHNHLKQAGFNSYVLYGRGKGNSDLNVFKTSTEWEGKLQSIYSRISGYFSGGSFFSTNRMIRKIKLISPDLVHIHLLNGNYVNTYRILSFLSENEIPTIMTLHAEITYTAICEHSYDCEKWKFGCGHCPQVFKKYGSIFFDRTSSEWEKKHSSFSKFKNLSVVSVSSWLKKRAEQSPMLQRFNFHIIGNGIDEKIFYPHDTNVLKEKYRIKDQKIVLHVTPSFKIATKGGEYVKEVANRFRSSNVIFFIIGFDDSKDKLPSNIIPVRHTSSQQELAQFYSLANLTLITSKLETFSLVCAESLSCGTPVVGFRAGALEEVAIPEYSDFVENGDVDALEISIKKWLTKNINPEDVLERVNHKYSKEKMFEHYKKLYESIQ